MIQPVKHTPGSKDDVELLVAMLAEKPCTLELLCHKLQASPPRITRYLWDLIESQWVEEIPGPGMRVFRLTLEGRRNHLSQKPLMPGSIPSAPQDPTSRKTIRTFFRQGALQQMPMQSKKRVTILHEFATLFRRNQLYGESEVNAIINQFYRDYCTIRREMVDHGLMIRKDGQYRLTP